LIGDGIWGLPEYSICEGYTADSTGMALCLLKSEDDDWLATCCGVTGAPSPSFIPTTCLNISASMRTCSVEKYRNSSEPVALLPGLTGSGGGGLHKSNITCVYM